MDGDAMCNEETNQAGGKKPLETLEYKGITYKRERRLRLKAEELILDYVVLCIGEAPIIGMFPPRNRQRTSPCSESSAPPWSLAL